MNFSEKQLENLQDVFNLVVNMRKYQLKKEIKKANDAVLGISAD